MKKQSFAMQYALREMKVRRHALIPAMCIAFGVVLLMNSFMIFFESEYRSDLAYHKVRTQLIMENLEPDEVTLLRSLDYVKSAEAVENGSTFICFVELEDEYCSDYGTYARTGLRIMEEMRLKNREPYSDYRQKYETFGLSFFLHCGLFNVRYVLDLQNNPVTSGSMMFIIFLSFLMHLASMTLVFGMKIRRSRKEYAAMRGMGAPMRILRQINQIEAVGITLVMYVPAFLVSVGGMYLVCRLSELLYAEYRMNSVLHFHIPWTAAGIALISYILAAYLAVFFCTGSLKNRTVAEMTGGSDAKIPFVEKSSAKHVNCPDFSLYGRLERKRNRKNLLPTQILFAALIAFPIMIASICTGGILNLGSSASARVPGSHVYTFRGALDDPDWQIPNSLASMLLDLDGITGVCDHPETERNIRESDTPSFRMKILGLPETYGDLSMHEAIDQQSALFGDENIPPRGTCIAPAELYKVGDTVTVTAENHKYDVTVSEVREDFIIRRDADRYSAYYAKFIVSDETMADIMGWEEPMYQILYVYCENGREEELIPLIERTAGYEGGYINDYDRQIHQERVTKFSGSARFIEDRITDIRDTFLILFLTSEAVYLLICAGAVIYSVTAYDVNGRRKELSVLRALGMDGESLRSMAVLRQVIGIVIMSGIAWLGLFLGASIADENIRLYKIPGTNQWVFEGIRYFISYLCSIGVTCAIALIGYGLCARRAAQKEVSRILSGSIAENIKQSE